MTNPLSSLSSSWWELGILIITSYFLYGAYLLRATRSECTKPNHQGTRILLPELVLCCWLVVLMSDDVSVPYWWYSLRLVLVLL